jgi:MFS family permease
MTRSNLVPGVGALAFGVLAFLALVVASPPGGNYSATDIAKYLEKGHRVAVLVSLYLMLLAVAGLICALAALRDRIGPQSWTDRFFWGSGIAGAASLAVGWAILITPPSSLSIGGAEAPESKVVYLITQAGFITALGAGGILLGFALVALMIGSAGGLPSWVRWTTLVAGLLGIASPAFFPFFGLLLWGVIVGVWLLASGRGKQPVGFSADAASGT